MISRRRPISTVVAMAGCIVAVAACSTSTGGSSNGGSQGKKPVGAFRTLTGITTTVILDPGFLKALTSLKLTPTTYGTGQIKTVGKDTDAIFPITGGDAAIYAKDEVTPNVQGEIDHNGSGLTLTSGSKKITIMNFVVHPGKNASLTGDVSVNGGTPLHAVKLFDLDGNTLKTPTISANGVATLAGTTIYLSTDAADALNGLFGITALAGGNKVKIGTAIIMATGTS